MNAGGKPSKPGKPGKEEKGLCLNTDEVRPQSRQN